MRPSAFKLDVRLEASEAAGGVEGSAKDKAAIQQQQGTWCEAADLDCPGVAKLQRRMTGGQQVDRLQRMASETMIAWLNGVKQILSEVYLPTLQHPHGVWPPQRLDQLHLHIGVMISVLDAGNPQRHFR